MFKKLTLYSLSSNKTSSGILKDITIIIIIIIIIRIGMILSKNIGILHIVGNGIGNRIMRNIG